jgi:putative flippase GtrA
MRTRKAKAYPGSSSGEAVLSAEGSRVGPQGRFAFLRAVKFAFATGLGFLVAEGVLVLGVFELYNTIEVPGISSSPTILGLDGLALGIGSTAAFLINEKVTVKNPGSKTKARWLERWVKYQLAKLMGNVLIVLIQLALLLTISLSPVYGSVVGAVLSYPVTYAVSMVFVWRLHPLRD